MWRENLQKLERAKILAFSSYVLGLFLALTPSLLLADEKENSSEDILVHPFLNDNNWDLSGLQLNGDLASQVTSYLNEKLNRPDISVQVRSNHGLNLSELFPNSESITLNFTKDGYPLCNFEVKAMNIAGTLTVLGKIPKLNLDAEEISKLPNLSSSLSTAWASLKSAPNQDKVISKSICLNDVEGSLLPVWQLVLSRETLKYKMLADANKVYKSSRLFFDINSAKVQTYPRDPVTDSETKVYAMETIDNTLSSTLFTTDPSTSESGVARASSDKFEFIYDPTDPLFDEASVFVHVNAHYSFFKAIGYQWKDTLPLIIKIHTMIGKTKNNALYQPSDGPDSNSLIMIGDGDDKILRNLAKDSDVVSHEFGHHVIFNNIQETSGESLILHEGLADYFVFAKNGDPCLGRSICVPNREGACIVPGQCLRIASKALTYGSEDYKNLDAHFKGQLISGFLYNDLNDIYDKKITPIMVFKALGLLVGDSGFKHLLLALMLADYQENQGINACKIYDAAVSRGFSPMLTDVDCTKLDSIKLITSDTKATEPRAKKKTNIFGCSGLGGLPSTGFDVGILFLFLPLLLSRRLRKD